MDNVAYDAKVCQWIKETKDGMNLQQEYTFIKQEMTAPYQSKNHKNGCQTSKQTSSWYFLDLFYKKLWSREKNTTAISFDFISQH